MQKVRYIINVKTWEVIKVIFNKDNLLISLIRGLPFNRQEYEKRILINWSYKELKGNSLVEVSFEVSPISLITSSYMLYNTQENKIRFVKLLMGKEL